MHLSEIARNAQLIAKLKASVTEAKRIETFDKETVIPAYIGYKGILVSNPEKRAGLTARFAMHKGTIELMDGQKRFLEDKDGTVEKMLMDEAIRKGVIDEGILKRHEVRREKRSVSEEEVSQTEGC